MSVAFALVVLVAVVSGFVAGVLLSVVVKNDVKKLEQGTQNAFGAVSADVQHLLARIQELEKAAAEKVKSEAKAITGAVEKLV